MCLYIGMGFTALKKLFLSILVCDLAPEDSQTPFIGKNIFVFKVPFVGSLNLCLKMPDTEQKTRTQSDQYGLRKGPNTADICKKSKIGILEYQQRVLWWQKYFDS